ncbi:MAG: hypothetical protein COA58_03080 [Bacteroidetes bacterium]|nr:MAG: hypothetical protein COA58_03080 [Bacteroidota bacterium]
MNTQEIANKLVFYCRQGDFSSCYAELYSPDCVSQEPKGAQWETANGMEEMAKKGEKWNSMVAEMHGAEVGDPIVAGNHFSCRMWNDMTFTDGNRVQMDELCVYEVQDGKIVREEFFYNVPSQ